MMTGTGSEDWVRVPGAVYGYPVRTGTEYGVRVTDTEYGYQVRGAGSLATRCSASMKICSLMF